jgi:flagellar protein FliO/FliZ
MKQALHVLLVLSLIIPLIIMCIYVVKRLLNRPLGKKNHHNMHITHQLALGSKERLVCVEVDGTRLLLGITPHAISTLHILQPRPTPKELA